MRTPWDTPDHPGVREWSRSASWPRINATGAAASPKILIAMSNTSQLETAPNGGSTLSATAGIDQPTRRRTSWHGPAARENGDISVSRTLARFRVQVVDGLSRLVALLAVVLGFISTAMAAVNVNTATKEQLMLLEGIGEVKAQAILDYRASKGPFKSVGDLINVPGIGEATLKKIQKDVVLTGGTGVASPAVAAKKEASSQAKSKADSAGRKASAPATTGVKAASPAKEAAPVKTGAPAPKADAKAVPAAKTNAPKGGSSGATSAPSTTPAPKEADPKKAAK